MTIGTSVLRRQDDRRVGETPAVRTGPVRIAGGDGDQVEVRDDVDGLPAVTTGEVRRVTVGLVEPPLPAVPGLGVRRALGPRRGGADVVGGNDLLAVPPALVEVEEADLGQVAGRQPQE